MYIFTYQLKPDAQAERGAISLRPFAIDSRTRAGSITTSWDA